MRQPHNRRGLPSHFVERLERQLFSLSKGVAYALLRLLDNNTALNVEGSEAATLQAVVRVRIFKLAV